MSESKVVNVKVANLRSLGYANLQEWMSDPDNVYIGRKGIVFIDGVRFPKKDSFWANPHKITKEISREQVIELYETHIRTKLDKVGWEKLDEIEGKNLGCWCAPEECHGNVLEKLMLEYYDVTFDEERDGDVVRWPADEELVNSKSLEELKSLKKLVEVRIMALTPKKPLNYLRIRHGLQVPDDFYDKIEWQKKVCFDLAMRLRGSVEDFRLFFLELVGDDFVAETDAKAARLFDKAYRELEAKLLAKEEKKVRKSLPKSKIVVIYDEKTDKYVSKYVE